MLVGGDRQGGVKMQYNCDMKTKLLTFLLAFTFLFLFGGSVFGQEEVKKEYYNKTEWDPKLGRNKILGKTDRLEEETHFKNCKHQQHLGNHRSRQLMNYSKITTKCS